MLLKHYLNLRPETGRDFADRAGLAPETVRKIILEPESASKRTVLIVFFATDGYVQPEDFWGELGRFYKSISIKTAILEYNLELVPNVNWYSVSYGSPISLKLARKISALTDGKLTVWELIKHNLPGIPDVVTRRAGPRHNRLEVVPDFKHCQKIC